MHLKPEWNLNFTRGLSFIRNMSQLPYHPGPNQTTPEQRLFLMNDEEWEVFIEQCARQLKTEGMYVQVLRLGGAGDKGRDVCGYSQDSPTEDTWDLYQAKHYEGTLSPSAFAPELAKFLSNMFSGSYTRPRHYFICALRVGPMLHDLVMKPPEFKAWILSVWNEKSGDFGTFKKTLSPELEAFVKNFPFEIIKVKTTADLLDIHERSDKHWERFGVLPARGPNPDMPDSPGDTEQKYVQALLEVYEEATKTAISDATVIPSSHKKHFKVQRQLFYSAEGLNRFSRDKIPGAFDDLVSQVKLGVGSDHAFPHPDGMSRLTKVLNTASTLQVTSNPLHTRLQAGDLQGACHHLANNEEISWIDKDE